MGKCASEISLGNQHGNASWCNGKALLGAGCLHQIPDLSPRASYLIATHLHYYHVPQTSLKPSFIVRKYWDKIQLVAFVIRSSFNKFLLKSV